MKATGNFCCKMIFFDHFYGVQSSSGPTCGSMKLRQNHISVNILFYLHTRVIFKRTRSSWLNGALKKHIRNGIKKKKKKKAQKVKTAKMSKSSNKKDEIRYIKSFKLIVSHPECNLNLINET